MPAINAKIPYTDVLLVGAGFASFTLLNRLRKLGLSVQIYEKGSASGGIWYWNCYPGARVDSDSPIYQLYDKDLYEDFTFTERYPGWQEIREYFKYVEKKWDVNAHTTFNKHVDSAVFQEDSHTWLIECSDDSQIECRWFIPCIGFASKSYSPPFDGLSDFKGEVYHTAKWPQHGVGLKNKRVAVVGTGASGIQVSQEIGDKVKHLTILQRTPNMCLPMNQKKLNSEEEEKKKKDGVYDEAFASAKQTFSGFTFGDVGRKTFDDSPEDREAFYKSLMDEGGFRFWLGNYEDLFKDKEANNEAYKYWRKRVLARVKNPEKQKLLAPEVPPHPWGTKRPSLEQRFYEVVDQDHVDIIDVNAHPVERVEATGLRLKGKDLIDLDVIVLATGFDSVTGSLGQLNIQGVNSTGTVGEHWRDGLRTALGIGMHDFPNMLFLYGPQAPTAFSNGPSCTQFQAEFVEELLKRATKDGITRLEPKSSVEEEWHRRMHEEWDKTLFPLAKSWYQGANIPGRKVEPLNFAGGLDKYCQALYDSLEKDYQGWEVQKGAEKVDVS